MNQLINCGIFILLVRTLLALNSDNTVTTLYLIYYFQAMQYAHTTDSQKELGHPLQIWRDLENLSGSFPTTFFQFYALLYSFLNSTLFYNIQKRTQFFSLYQFYLVFQLFRKNCTRMPTCSRNCQPLSRAAWFVDSSRLCYYFIQF